MNGIWKKIALVGCIAAAWGIIFLVSFLEVDSATANQLIIGAYSILTVALTAWAVKNGNGNGKE